MSVDGMKHWDENDLGALLDLEPVGEDRFATRRVDANAHGRAYGGQMLANAIGAAARTVPEGRRCTALQFMFLQGTLLDRPVELQVTRLQDGKRFSTRHVRGSQAGGRLVLDAQVSFAAPFKGPTHGIAPSVPLGDPDALPPASQVSDEWKRAVEDAFGYLIGIKPVLDFRLADPPASLRLSPQAPTLRFWTRVKHRLPDDENLHAAAFAYVSDWWVNYAAAGAHQDEAVAGGGLYIASLNHTLWLHHPLRADEWLHFESISPAAGHGRGLTVVRVHDRQGRLVASAAQECLLAA